MYVHVHVYKSSNSTIRNKLKASTPESLISPYGAPLAQRAFYLALHSSLFRPDSTVNYDYIITNCINSLLIGSRCIPIGTHTNHF